MRSRNINGSGWVMTESLQIARLIVDSSMFIVIWMVQLIIYPAFRSIDPALFHDWHRKYMRTISIFVIPLMLMQASCIGAELYYFPGPLVLAAAVSVMCAWLVTFGISAPCHSQLQKNGRTEELIARLIATNWIRTLCWSIAWLLNLRVY